LHVAGRLTDVPVVSFLDGDAVALAVEDGGPGLPAAERARMFELFYRAGSNLREASGTGIGLFVVAQLVASMGGTVLAEPLEPHGLRVVVRLPTESAAEAAFDDLGPQGGRSRTGRDRGDGSRAGGAGLRAGPPEPAATRLTAARPGAEGP
jgi:hypothetical protein